jgi:chromosome segregation ATPase
MSIDLSNIFSGNSAPADNPAPAPAPDSADNKNFLDKFSNSLTELSAISAKLENSFVNNSNFSTEVLGSLTGIRDKIKALNTEANILREKVKANEAECNGKIEEIKTTKAALEELTGQKREVEIKMKKLEGDMNQLNSSNQAIIANKDKQITDLQAEIAQEKEKIDTDIKTNTEKINKLQEQIDTLEKENTDYIERIKRATEVIGEALTAINKISIQRDDTATKKEINEMFPEYEINHHYKCDEDYSVRMIGDLFFIIATNCYILRIFNIFSKAGFHADCVPPLP